MKISPIQYLEVYYCVNSWKTNETQVSLRVDGTNIYTLDLQRKVKASSGENTVGAFKTDNKDSIFAWIDPVSKEFISTSAEVFDTLLGAAIIVVGLVVAKALGHASLLLRALPIVGTLLLASSYVILTARRNSFIEAGLRAAMVNAYAVKTPVARPPDFVIGSGNG